MSRTTGPIPDLAIEYSGRGVTVYDSATRSTKTFNDLASAGVGNAGRTAVIGLSRRSVFVRTTRVPSATPEEVRQILTIRASEIFPVGPADLAVDFRLTEDVDLEGRLAVVCGVPVTELRRVREEAKAAGFRVIGVVPVAFGSVSIAKALNLQSAAIVSRDQEGIGIDLIVGGEVRQSRVVPSHASVESEVCRTYTVAGLPCGNVVAADGIVLKDPDADTNESPLAALIDAFPAHLGVDLVLPEEALLRRQKVRADKNRTAFLLAAAAAAVLIFEWNQWSLAMSDLDIQTRKENTKVTKARDAKKMAESNLAKEKKLEATLRRGFEPAQRLGDSIAYLTNLAPAGIWITGISAERGKPISVQGTATNGDGFAAYLQQLNASKRIRKVTMVFTNNAEIQRQPVQQFSITAFPIGNLPLVDPNAKAKKGAKK